MIDHDDVGCLSSGCLTRTGWQSGKTLGGAGGRIRYPCCLIGAPLVQIEAWPESVDGYCKTMPDFAPATLARLRTILLKPA